MELDETLHCNGRAHIPKKVKLLDALRLCANCNQRPIEVRLKPAQASLHLKRQEIFQSLTSNP
jgi:hypothetical protein